MQRVVIRRASGTITPIHGLTAPSVQASTPPHTTMARQLRSSTVKASASSSSAITQSQASTPSTAKSKTSRRSQAQAQPRPLGVTKPAKKPPSRPIPPPSPSSTPGSTPQDGYIFPSLASFTTFLTTNHSLHPQGIWLRLSKKSNPTPSLSYDEALDASLCFGWIDGQRKSLAPSPESVTLFAQRFHPRRSGGSSLWSRRNCDRVEQVLEPGGLMAQPGIEQVDAAKADGRWARAYAGSRDIEVPDDLRDALRAEGGTAEGFFDGLSRTKRYPFLLRVLTVKTPEGRRKRIEQNVELLAQGKTL